MGHSFSFAIRFLRTLLLTFVFLKKLFIYTHFSLKEPKFEKRPRGKGQKTGDEKEQEKKRKSLDP